MDDGQTQRASRGLPLPVWGAILSTASMNLGWNWDISWHRSVGRDTPFTLPHVAIYLALALAFAYNAWLVLHETRRGREGRGIRVLGFRGPSGAFVTLWSVLLQFAAILFDDWWHKAFGLDSFVFTPSHFLLALGVSIFYLGQFMVIAFYMNIRGESRALRWAALIVWSLFLGHQLIGMDPQFGPFGIRSRAFLVSSAIMIAPPLLFIHGYLRWRWAATVASLLYMGEIILMMQIFQLFPAKPVIGPVYYPELRILLPPAFPLLLVVPAAVMSALVVWGERRGRVLTFSLVGLAFTVLFTATNWLSSGLVAGPWGQNAFFGGHYPGSVFREDYFPVLSLDLGAMSGLMVALSVLLAAVGSFGGYVAGRWLRTVVR